MTIMLPPEKLAAYRHETFNLSPERWLRSPEEAADFVNRRGFIFFWPIKNTILPSLWNATVGERGVPNNHNDPGHVTWGWKDQLLGKHIWHYGRVLHKRNAMISLALLPAFYALSPNYGDPETDYLDQYTQGLLSPEAKNIYALLLQHGPLDSLTLRREAGLSSSSSASRFNRALETLQMEFKIMPVGVSDAGRWHYAFIYDLVTQHIPDLQEQARAINASQARRQILHTYLKSVGAIEQKQAARLLRWEPAIGQQTTQSLVNDGLLIDDVQISEQTGKVIALKDIFQEKV
ncbi:MAG: winged helix DNA-binding domain-containing protein [Anaerolineaceae bacterium]|nr:winged helix DNA-binding domain-containing protein [Anaerolineaceae bacterium]